MKRYLIPIVLLLAAVGCQKPEENASVSGEPYFSIVVRDDSAIPVATLDPMSAQYTLEIGASAWSASANTNNHVEKAVRFNVSSNLRWKVVPATEEAEPWVRPFPDAGEKEGLFFFKAVRNINPDEERTAYFNILVDKGTGYYEPIEGLLTVTQKRSAHFLEMNAAKFSVESAGGRIRLYVTANVDWTYALTPMADYGTADTNWITDESEHDTQVDTLVFQVAPNELGIRGADLTINYNLDGTPCTEVIPITQYPATEADLEGFPVKWVVRSSDNTFAGTWPGNGTIPPVSGDGMITWHNEVGKAADTGGKIVLDVSDNSPRAAGVWPGDYLEIVAASPVSAGSIVKVVFGTRVSGTGQKYWRLEFRDGEEWKIVGKPQTDPDVAGPDGNPVVYTHAMASDGSTNVLVDGLATYTANTDQVEFRFICAANYQANGNGPLSAPNGGTWRLSVNDEADGETRTENPYQPQISVVAAGSEILTRASLNVTPAYLVFEGKKSSSRKFNVSSDQDFTITPSHSWIHVNATEASAGEDLSFTVTCDDNTQATTREGSVTIKAGITRKEVAIVQGSGASDMDPLISIASGNAIQVPYTAGETVIRIQANVDISTQSLADWLTVAPATKAAVETREYVVSYTANDDTQHTRTGSIRFYNAFRNLESVLTVTQAKNTGGILVYFADDFSWLKPLVDAYVAEKPSAASSMDPVGSNLASHEQPNVWSKYASTAGALFTSKGYVDLEHEAGIGNNTLYVQDCYFKMGAGSKQTGLRLPPIDFEGDTPVDVVFTFDWCAHMSAAGNIDVVPLVVELIGGGTCADSGAAKSNVFTTTQTKGTLAWQHASVVLQGVTKNTRIEIKPDYATFTESGNHRWHLDNLRITEIQ